MNRIYSNIKQIALSLLVVGLAISTQAFKNANNSENLTTAYLVQTSSGVWEQRTAEPELDDCAVTQDRQCYYQVNDISILTQSTFNSMDIDNYLSSSPAKIESGQNSSPALYVGD